MANAFFDEVERRDAALTRSDLDWPIEDGWPAAEQWLVEGGGHAWFRGDPRGSFTQTVGLDASRVMVRFLWLSERACATDRRDKNALRPTEHGADRD